MIRTMINKTNRPQPIFSVLNGKNYVHAYIGTNIEYSLSPKAPYKVSYSLLNNATSINFLNENDAQKFLDQNKNNKYFSGFIVNNKLKDFINEKIN